MLDVEIVIKVAFMREDIIIKKLDAMKKYLENVFIYVKKYYTEKKLLGLP